MRRLRDRGQSLVKEELVESPVILVSRVVTGISKCYTEEITPTIVCSIVKSLNILLKNDGSVGRNRIIDQQNDIRANYELFQALHLGLLTSSTATRAVCARALRYFIVSSREFYIILRLNSSVPIARIIDTSHQSSQDYFHTVRLVSSLFRLVSNECSTSELVEFFSIIINSCCSAIIYQSSVPWQQHQSTSKQYLAVPRKLTAEVICEACLVASLPSAQMLHALMAVATSETFYLSVNEAIVGVFIHLLNYPHTRKTFYSSGALELLIARFSDDTVTDLDPFNAKRSTHEENKALAFQWKAAQFTLTKLFHSCSGAIALLSGNFCKELLAGLSPPMGFEPGADTRSYFITSQVSSRRIKRQQELLGLFAAVFNIVAPTWTADINEAIMSTDPRKFEESWMISEGFVAAEAEDLIYFRIPRKFAYISPRPDPVSTLVALILSAFMEARIVSALSTFSLSCFQYSRRGTKPSVKSGNYQSDPHLDEVERLGVTATVILAHILYQSKKLLRDPSSAWTEIEECISAFHNGVVTPEKESIVSKFVQVINLTEKFMSAADNKPSSLHLELILRYCPRPNKTEIPNDETRLDSNNVSFAKHLFYSTGLVYAVPTFESDKWPSIRMLLNIPKAEIRRAVAEGDLMKALQNLASFYKSTNSFCHRDITSHMRSGGRTSKSNVPDIAHCAISLIEFLLPSGSNANEQFSSRGDYYRIAGEWISDICKTLKVVANTDQCPVGENGAGHLAIGLLPRVGAQFWFAILGACTSLPNREDLLEDPRLNAFEILSVLVESSSNEVMKLTLSFLNYSLSKNARIILKKALESSEDEVRMYAVRFVAGLWPKIDSTFEFSNWALPLITPMISDKQWKISDTALNMLLDILPKCYTAGAIIRSLSPPYKINETNHRLLYGSCLAAPGVWHLPNAEEMISKEIKAYVADNIHGEYSQYCDEILVEAFTSSYSREPGPADHFSHMKSNRRLRLPGRQSPPSIFSICARNQMGVCLLGEVASDFVKHCGDTVVFHSEIDPLADDAPKYDSETVASIRSSICVLANIGSTSLGADWIMSLEPFLFGPKNLVQAFHSLAMSSPVFSVRGTAVIALSVVASSFDEDMLVDCKWADRRLISTVGRLPSSMASFPMVDDAGESIGSPFSNRQLSIPDINIHFAQSRESSTRHTSVDIAQPSSEFRSSSSSCSSDNEETFVSANNRYSLPVQQHRQSLPMILSGENTASSKTGRFSFRRRISLFFKKSKSAANENASRKNSLESKPRASTGDSTRGIHAIPGAKAKSYDALDGDIASTSSGLMYQARKCDSPLNYTIEENPSPNDSLIQDIHLRQTTRTSSLVSQRSGDLLQARSHHPPSLLSVLDESRDELAQPVQFSSFYLPMEELSDYGQSECVVFLPSNVSELLKDPLSTTPGFRETLPKVSALARRISLAALSVGVTQLTQQGGSAKSSVHPTAEQQLFPPGEADEIIGKHDTGNCLICCFESDIGANHEITDEWHQVLWLVVALQIWPNKTPKMLMNYIATNKHLVTNGCLYSEVVLLMSKLALPRASRTFVHSLFDPSAFAPLLSVARCLTKTITEE